MNIQLQGRNITINDRIQEYVEKKSARLERYLPQIDEVRGELTRSSTRSSDDRFTFQLTIWANRQILRSEEITGDIFASIDAAIDKVARQIEKVEGRRKSRRKKAASIVENTEAVLEAVALIEDLEENDEPRIMRRKQFVLQPMNEEEAQEQLELLGHDFFLYYNPDDKSVNLIYRRKDGNFGLLQPQVA